MLIKILIIAGLALAIWNFVLKPSQRKAIKDKVDQVKDNLNKED